MEFANIFFEKEYRFLMLYQIGNITFHISANKMSIYIDFFEQF